MVDIGDLEQNGKPIEAIFSATKTADTDRISDTAMTDDPHLSITGIPLGGYFILGILLTTEANNNPDFKFQLAAQASLVGSIYYNIDHDGDFNDDIYKKAFSSDSGKLQLDSTTNNNTFLKGFLIVTTVGTLTLQWAQFLSDTDYTRLSKDSSLILIPV